MATVGFTFWGYHNTERARSIGDFSIRINRCFTKVQHYIVDSIQLKGKLYPKKTPGGNPYFIVLLTMTAHMMVLGFTCSKSFFPLGSESKYYHVSVIIGNIIKWGLSLGDLWVSIFPFKEFDWLIYWLIDWLIVL